MSTLQVQAELLERRHKVLLVDADSGIIVAQAVSAQAADSPHLVPLLDQMAVTLAAGGLPRGRRVRASSRPMPGIAVKRTSRHWTPGRWRAMWRRDANDTTGKG